MNNNTKTKKNTIYLLGFFLFAFIISVLLFYLRLTVTGSSLLTKLIADKATIRVGITKLMKVYDLPYIFLAGFKKDSLSTISLIINQKDLDFLNSNLPKEGLLTDEYKQVVPAQLRYNYEIYPVTVRYRGDKPNHWTFSKKSWRIRFKDKTPFEDVYSLNLILPEDRGFYEEALSFYVAKKMGLFSLKHFYVNLTVNNQPMGVYFLVEHWTKEAVARNNYNSDTNLYGGINYETGFPDNLYSSADLFKNYLSPSDDLKEKARLPLLIELINTADDETFHKQIDQVLDLDKYIAWQAHSQLFFNYNYGMTHNAKILLNRETNKLEFLPWDIALSNPEEHSLDEFDYNPLMSRVFTDPALVCQRDLILFDYVSDANNLVGLLAYLDHLYQGTRWAMYKDQQKQFINLDLDLRVYTLKKQLKQSFNKILTITADSVEDCRKKGLLN